jgi:transposase
VLDAVPDACPVTTAVADKAFDSDAIRADLARRGIDAVIPPLACRTRPIRYDKEAYRGRNRVERLFSKLKQFRRIATRYDKLDTSFLAFIHLVSALIMTR